MSRLAFDLDDALEVAVISSFSGLFIGPFFFWHSIGIWSLIPGFVIGALLGVVMHFIFIVYSWIGAGLIGAAVAFLFLSLSLGLWSLVIGFIAGATLALVISVVAG